MRIKFYMEERKIKRTSWNGWYSQMKQNKQIQYYLLILTIIVLLSCRFCYITTASISIFHNYKICCTDIHKCVQRLKHFMVKRMILVWLCPSLKHLEPSSFISILCICGCLYCVSCFNSSHLNSQRTTHWQLRSLFICCRRKGFSFLLLSQKNI